MPESRAAARARQRLQAHQELEEEVMARVPLSKKERKAIKVGQGDPESAADTVWEHC